MPDSPDDVPAPTVSYSSAGLGATGSPPDLTSQPARVDPGARALDDRAGWERYEWRRKLGEGGMGEVRLCRDRRIGREVAMKVIRAGGDGRQDLRDRFVREARVQGQLVQPWQLEQLLPERSAPRR